MARLNEMIKYRRKELGLTLNQVAEKTGVKEATVQRWESGNIKTIKYQTIELLSHALNCTPQYLMGWEKESPAPESGHEELYSLINQLSDDDLDDVLEFVRYKLSKK